MKRTISILLAAVLAFGMVATGFAASSKTKVTSIEDDVFRERYGAGASEVDMTDFTFEPDKEYIIYLAEESMTIENLEAGEFLTYSDLSSRSDFKIKTSYKKGSDLIDKVEFKSKEITVQLDDKTSKKVKVGVISIKTVETFTKTSSEDIEFSIRVYLGSKSQTTLEIDGQMEIEEYEISSDDGEFFSTDEGATVLKPTDFIRNAEVDIGEGVSIFANLSKGKKYYGSVEVGVITSADEKIVTKYEEIKTILTLNTSGFTSDAKVKIDLGDTYYVYDKDGKYIGTTDDEELKYSDKYYLAEKKISISSSSSKDDEDEDEDEDDDEEEVVYSSSSSSSNNNTSNNSTSNNSTSNNYDDDYYYNDNPETGVNAAAGIAMMAGVAAAAAIMLATRKK